MDKYLYIAPSVIIQRYESRDRELFVLQSPEQNEKERLTGGKRYKINSVAAEIIACLDGTRTFGEIVAYFSKKYSDDETHVRQTVQSYFDKLESLYGFSVKEIEEPTLFPVQFTDYKSIYPTVVSIELTDKCNFRSKKISEMSKGMKSKMMLATALAHTPKLLVLDEITSGLDPVVRDDILHILKDYVAETSNAVFFSTHITSDLDKIADRVAFLHEGELIFEEEIENLRKRFILYTCSDTSTTMSDESAVVAKYSEFNNTHYLLEKEKTVLKGNVPTIDDIMLLYIKGREKK